jgi:nicotinamidase-related amidase
MPLDLAELLSPDSCAVLTHELQVGIVGDDAPLQELVQATRTIIEPVRRLTSGARAVGVPVVHNAKGDDAVPGARPNSPLASAMAKLSGGGVADSRVLPAIEPDPDDVFVVRHHGMSAFPGTELDSILRLLGVDTIIATGVSINVGVFALIVDAVSRGYRVVVATDAVAGVPVEYAQSVLDNSISVLATRLTTQEILDIWGS